MRIEKTTETFGIISPRGFFTNVHWLPDGNIGENVTKETATHRCVVKVTVEPLD